MPVAVEHIRRMRGGAQAHLLRCADGGYYVVKFQNNPQAANGGRILANELLGTRLAARLGLPTPAAAVVEVRQELIDLSEELAIQIGMQRTKCRAGFQFGSQFPGQPAEVAVHDFLPDERLGAVENLSDFVGALVFDKWTCNTNGRQAIFFQPVSGPAGVAAGGSYQARLIDQGFCFNAGEWNFPDAPLRGLYARHRVYESVRGMVSFEPWLERLERINERALDEIAKEIPPEWMDGDLDALFGLLERLRGRRRRVPELILDAKNSYRQPFVNWR
jgi:hypothetical protein